MRAVPPPPTPTDAAMELQSVKNSMAWNSHISQALRRMKRDKTVESEHGPKSAYMTMAVEEACSGVVMREGGPFGAVITMEGENGEEEVIARGHNMVLQTNDPTAHAEVTAIRKAAARLGTFNLEKCTLYTSCYPCPMCYGAIHWAKIRKCFYAATAETAAEAGFDDKFIYDAIRGTAVQQQVNFKPMKHEGAIAVFKGEYDMYCVVL